jgi:protocatechuate 3,4-dioxygenase alpha subunit
VSALTPSQTVGPFFSIGLDHSNRLPGETANRPRGLIVVTGRILDAEGIPVPDAQLELWRAAANGKYPSVVPLHAAVGVASFDGFTRVATNDEGLFAFETVLPGAVPGPQGGMQAPHIVAAIFMRGLLLQLYTRIYFADQAANAADPVLAKVPKERRRTLVAQPEENSPNCYRWDVHLQGSEETVFFAY